MITRLSEPLGLFEFELRQFASDVDMAISVVVSGDYSLRQILIKSESLILAQNERWRQA